MIKAAFFDIDGTLYSHKIKAIPESTYTALGMLRERGVFIAAATGRYYAELMTLPERIRRFDAYLLSNGQVVFDGDMNLLFSSPYKGADEKALIDIFNEKKIPIIFAEEREFYINTIDDRARDTLNALGSPIPEVRPYSGRPVYQATAYTAEEDFEFLKSSVKDCTVAHWYKYVYDLVINDGGKGRAMIELLSRLGISPEDVIAFGDADNDIDMIRRAGIGVAVGHSDPRLQEVADIICDDIEDNGIYKVICSLLN